MTIGDLIKNKDYDYVSYRLTLPDGDDTFAGCFSSKNYESRVSKIFKQIK